MLIRTPARNLPSFYEKDGISPHISTPASINRGIHARSVRGSVSLSFVGRLVGRLVGRFVRGLGPGRLVGTGRLVGLWSVSHGLRSLF